MVEFSRDIFDTICTRIAEGESLLAILRDKDMPSYTSFMVWVKRSEELAEKYARARETSADADADKIGDIAQRTLAGEFDPASARVAIDALKWAAGKRKPKVYGDKLALGGAEDLGPVIFKTVYE